MSTAHIGVLISAAGYLLAIAGGVKLYKNVPPDRPFGSIPMFSGDPTEFQQREHEGVSARLRASRIGFLMVTIGSGAQLLGTLVSGFFVTVGL